MNKIFRLLALSFVLVGSAVSYQYSTSTVGHAFEVSSVAYTASDFYLSNQHEVLSEEYHSYHLSINTQKELTLNDTNYLNVYWTFDNVAFVGERNNLAMAFTVSSDPSTVHTVKINIKFFENSVEKQSLDLDEFFLKDGNLLLEHPNKRESGLRKIYLPIIAVVLLIAYLIYFHKQQHSGGLDFASERLAHVSGMSSIIEDTFANEKLSSKAKLKTMKKTYKTIKTNLITILHLINAVSIEASISIDNKVVIDEINETIAFMEKANLKTMTLEDYDSFYKELFSKHIDRSLKICRRVIDAHKKYLKDTYGDY